jgi:hypothetical protein
VLTPAASTPTSPSWAPCAHRGTAASRPLASEDAVQARDCGFSTGTCQPGTSDETPEAVRRTSVATHQGQSIVTEPLVTKSYRKRVRATEGSLRARITGVFPSNVALYGLYVTKIISFAGIVGWTSSTRLQVSSPLPPRHRKRVHQHQISAHDCP